MRERNSLIFGAHIFLFLMVFLGLVGVLAWWVPRRLVAEKHISFGEKSLIPGKPSPHKEAGMGDIKAENWTDAQDKLEKSLTKNPNDPEANPNDPEARIFLNNAKIGSTQRYTIAVSVPISKDSKDSKDINNSLEILRGVAQAQDEFNFSRGEKQWRLKVAIASDENDKKVAPDVATALVNNRDVLGVVGHYASDVTIAASRIYTSKKLVAITPISTSVDLTKNSDSSYIFRTVPSDSVTAKALADHMLQYWKKNNVAVFYNSDSNYSRSLKSEFKTVVVKAGGRVSKEFNLNEQNFSAALSVQQAIKQGTEVLMLAADTDTLEKAREVVRSAKGKNLKILAGDDVYTPDTLKVGDAAVGMVVAAFWHIDNAPNQKFVKKSKELWGGAIVNWRTALAYDATWALIKAIQDQPNPTRSGVQQALLSPKDKPPTGASGYIEFCRSGDRKNAKVELVKIVSTNNSSNPYKFVPVAPRKDKPSSNCPDSPTNNNSSPTPTSSPLPTATPTLTKLLHI